MYDYLKQHAIQTAWCSPDQDNQIIRKLQRITRSGGERVSFPIMMRRITLPLKDRRFHVYQFGQAHPTILGLLPKVPDWSIEGWTTFSAAVEALPLFCDIYTDKGVHLPLHRTYYMYTNDRALIFAIDSTNESAVDYESEAIYLRLYSNAYFESDEGDTLTSNTRSAGALIKSTDDTLLMQAKLKAMEALPGVSLSFVNGELVKTLSLKTIALGDVVEFIHDASIKRVVDLQVKDLLTFKSTLDSCFKYLLHYPETGEAQIDYLDDVDMYIVYKSGDQELGRFFHRNTSHTMRMVTHRDYSVPVDHFVSIAEGLAPVVGVPSIDFRELYIRLYIRKGGLTRPLIYDHQRVFELYKLADADIVGAMVGVDATMPYWTADALEQSAYNELMRSEYMDLNIDLINRAYGYNAITRVIGESPQSVTPRGSLASVELSQAFHTHSTIYEYGSDRRLLGFYQHTAGSTYLTKNEGTVFVEGIVGTGSASPERTVGQTNLAIPVGFSYRVYMCYLVGGVPTNDWKDITGSDYYTVVDGFLVWSNLESGQWLMIRSDETFLAYTMEVPAVAGTYFFSLAELVDGNNEIMTLPRGDLDIWVNGAPCIEGLDHIVEFPRISLINKGFLKQPAETTVQEVTVRFTGLCDSALNRKLPEDYGFVEQGVLSNNNRFDVRDDRVLRISVAGQLRLRDELVFSEQHSGISITDASNGSPYQIKDVVVPLRALDDDETYALRALSLAVDASVEAYMTIKLPQPPRGTLNAIPRKWVVVSPFFCRLINDLKNGDFNVGALSKVLSDQEVLTLCAPYEPLLTADPLNTALNFDYRYVAVHPTQLNTPIALSLDCYRFIQRVVAFYGRDQITLSPHLTVSLGG